MTDVDEATRTKQELETEALQKKLQLDTDRKLLYGTLKLDDEDLPDQTSPPEPTKRDKPILREIDVEQFTKLAKLGCTWTEISDFYGVSIPVLKKYLSANYEKGRADLKITIRRAQIQEAILRGNAALLIFLGKNLLGQSDGGEISTDEATEVTFVTKLYRKTAEQIDASVEDREQATENLEKASVH